jgi:hypothetical protein
MHAEILRVYVCLSSFLKFRESVCSRNEKWMRIIELYAKNSATPFAICLE